MSKVYLVTYSPTPPFDQSIFRNYIMSLSRGGKISDWWHYIDSTYFVVSNLTASALYESIFPGVPRRNLLVIEITKNNAQGWLPRAAWDWIQKYLGPQQA